MRSSRVLARTVTGLIGASLLALISACGSGNMNHSNLNDSITPDPEEEPASRYETGLRLLKYDDMEWRKLLPEGKKLFVTVSLDERSNKKFLNATIANERSDELPRVIVDHDEIISQLIAEQSGTVTFKSARGATLEMYQVFLGGPHRNELFAELRVPGMDSIDEIELWSAIIRDR